MRPLFLSMSAFGPFATTQTIDFTALGNNPLFLINGPTGAGKTTLLDGICFALYGKTTGNEREGSQMRCDMADDGVLTEVVFSFQLGAARYRIRRVPEQERSKKSGEGSTLQKSEAQLYRIDADGSEQLLVATKVSEATNAIETLTGLDVEQFRQVMVLPQGKFRELLMADSKAREQIFSQLFQTHIYRRIEDKLKDQASQIRALVKEQRARRDGILQNCALQNDEELNAQLAALTPELTLAQQAKEQAVWQQQQAHKAYDAAQHLQDEFAQLEALKQALSILESQQGDMAAKTEELHLAKQAERLGPMVAHLRAREQEAKDAEDKLSHAVTRFTQTQQTYDEAQLKAKDIPELESRLQAQEGIKIQLTELGPRLSELERLTQRVQQEQAQLLTVKAQCERDKAALTALSQQRKDAELSLVTLQAKGDMRLPLQQTYLQQQQLLAAYEQWQQVVAKVEATKTQLAQAAGVGQQLKLQYQEAQQAYQSLLLVWHQGQAAILALQLRQGAPCPVCGSLSHPQPAQSVQTLPSDEALQLAQEAQNRAQEQLSSARAEYRGLQTHVTTLQQQADDCAVALGDAAKLSLVDHQQALSQAAVALQQAEQAYQQQLQLQGEIAKLQLQAEEWQLQLESLQLQSSGLQSSVDLLGGQLAQLQQGIPQELGSLAALGTAQTQNDLQLAQFKQQIAQLRSHSQLAAEAFATAKAALEAATASKHAAAEQQTLAQHQLEEQLAGAGFADQASLLKAMRDEAHRQQLASAIEHYEQQRALTQAQSEQLSAKLKDKTVPDMLMLADALQLTQLALDSAEEAWQTRHTRMALLTQTHSQLQLADAKAHSLEEQYAVIGTLADVASGNTGNKISLQRFVLSVLLDDVLLEASRRLHLMSKGRYRLLRKEDRAKGNKASGLELEVEDAYTAKVRPVATLSGGESFMAALSMALGLSDVVQAYAGGIKLDTLFIDEGFGSLDQESLEMAIRTLMDLQSSGRMIGVISHVSEMKEQITTRIDIAKASHGSQIALVLP